MKTEDQKHGLSPLGAGTAAPVGKPVWLTDWKGQLSAHLHAVSLANRRDGWASASPYSDRPGLERAAKEVADAEQATIRFVERLLAAPTLPEAAAQEGDSAGLPMLVTINGQKYTVPFTVREYINRLESDAEVAAKQAQPVDIETAAKAIYVCFPDADKHPWAEGGNSLMQDKARRYARAAFRAAPATHSQPAQCTNPDSWNCKYCKVVDCAALKDPRNFGKPAAPSEGAQAEKFQVREIGEEDWRDASRESYEQAQRDPTMDYRTVPATPTTAADGAQSDGQIYAEVSRRADPEAYDAALAEMDRAVAPLASSADPIPDTVKRAVLDLHKKIVDYCADTRGSALLVFFAPTKDDLLEASGKLLKAVIDTRNTANIPPATPVAAVELPPLAAGKEVVAELGRLQSQAHNVRNRHPSTEAAHEAECVAVSIGALLHSIARAAVAQAALAGEGKA
jgi:hypothetical protein